MKKTAPICIALLMLIAVQLQAQSVYNEDSVAQEAVEAKHIFTLNPISLLVGEHTIFYEYETGKPVTYGAALGYINGKVYAYSDDVVAPLFESNGFVVRGFRKKKRAGSTAYKTKYRTLTLQYRFFTASDITQSASAGDNQRTVNFDRNTHVLGVNWQWGRMRRSGGTVVDFYYGVGGVFSYLDDTYNYWSEYADGPKLTNFPQNNGWDDVLRSGLYFYPTIHLGVRFGGSL